MTIKELHLFLDLPLKAEQDAPRIYRTYTDTLKALSNNPTVIHTTQPAFLSFRYAEKLFVHTNNETHEITIGKCEGTNREIREAHNLEKLLFAGAFDYFTGLGIERNWERPKEIYLFLEHGNKNTSICDTYIKTMNAIKNGNDVIYTTQPNFLSFSKAERIFVFVKDKIHEITVGECEGTDKWVQSHHNIEKMLLAGAFDFFDESEYLSTQKA